MALSSVWGNVPHIDDIDSNMDNTSGKISKEKLTEQKIMKNNVLVTAKIRKLMLRIELWNIYEKIFLSDDKNIKNKNRAAAELLDFALDGQISAQKRIATIFSSDGIIENWETVISKLKYFEDESDTIPLVSTEDTNIPVTEQLVQVRTSDDQVIKEVMLDFATDTYQMACEIQMEYRLPADEIEYMQGMLQHEMMGLARQGMTKQREKLKSIQKKTAIIEHLVMLNENVSMKFHKTSKMYDTSSTHLKASAAPTTPTPSFQTSTRTPVSSKNRTLVHFNKLIIDERRKLDQVEQEMVKLFKKMGKMSASDYYKTKSGIPIFTNGKEIPVDKKANNKSSINSGGNNSAPSPSAKAGGRRASVSLRSVMMQPLQVSTISLEEGDEDDEDGDTFGGSMGSGGGSLRGGLFSPMKSPGPGLGSNTSVVEDDEEEEMNTFGLSDHEIEKKMLFRKSEKDRTLLIAENKRLRDIINSVDMHLPDVMTSAKQLRGSSGNENLDPAAVSNLDDGDLRGLINELNAWDIERDELDGQIDNLNDKKDALKRKIQKQKEKKMKKIADKELMKISMLATMSAMSVSSR